MRVRLFALAATMIALLAAALPGERATLTIAVLSIANAIATRIGKMAIGHFRPISAPPQRKLSLSRVRRPPARRPLKWTTAASSTANAAATSNGRTAITPFRISNAARRVLRQRPLRLPPPARCSCARQTQLSSATHMGIASCLPPLRPSIGRRVRLSLTAISVKAIGNATAPRIGRLAIMRSGANNVGFQGG